MEGRATISGSLADDQKLENKKEPQRTKLTLWRVFLLGRTATTTLFLIFLFVVNSFAIPSELEPVFAVAALQVAVNAAYLYLWKRRRIVLLGYLCFGVEIALLTLNIINFGADGHVFVLSYLWPIMMAGWLIGHKAILPLTLFSCLTYVLVIWLQQSGLSHRGRVLMPDGTPQALILALPYLALSCLFLWLLTTEREHSENRLATRNKELAILNEQLRCLVSTSEQALTTRDTQGVLQATLPPIRRLLPLDGAALYIRTQGLLALRDHWGAPEAPEQSFVSELAIPTFARKQDPSPSISRNEHGIQVRIPLLSRDGLSGMLILTMQNDEALEQTEDWLFRLLGHQLGSILHIMQLLEDLRHERDLLQGIMSNMAEGVLVVDDEGQVLMQNRAAQDLVSSERDALLESDLIANKQDSHESRQGRRLLEKEGRFISLSQTELPSTNSLPNSTIYVARDVTEQVQVDRMKSDFVAYASHELRTPVTTVKMLTHLLQMDAEAESNQKRYLDMIDAQLDRQERLINNLLDLTKLEAGKYGLSPEEVNLRALLGEIVEPLGELARQKGVELEMRCPGIDPVKADRGALDQILTNIISNAIKFTPEGGSITVICRQNTKDTRIAVTDTGVGMSEEQVERIFSKFYTVRKPHRHGEGTGLGLALARMLIEKLGGHIEVESSLGKGSCFQVILPRGAMETDS